MATAQKPANRVAVENDLARVDIVQKISGAAKFTADQRPGGMIYASFIQFPHGSGRIRSANVDAARAVKGVLEVELDTAREATYAGDRMGHVVAESRVAIEDAIDALQLRYAIGAPVATAAQYSGPVDLDAEKQQAVEQTLAGAEAVVEATYETQVQTHSSFEPHGGVVDFRGDSAEVWGSTQGTFAYQGGIAGPLGLPPSEIVVHNEFVGGGFGSKFGPDREGTMAAQMSRKYNRPCMVMCDRKQEHLDTGNRPGSIQYMKIGAARDGGIVGGRVHITGIVGHQQGGGNASNPAMYNFGAVERTYNELLLNAGRPRAMRSPGWPQGLFAVESMMDELAASLGMDPVEFRKKNDPSDRRKRQYDIGADLIGWDQRGPDGAGPGRVKRGMGCGATEWYFRNVDCNAEAEAYRNGRVVVRCGIQDIGTGATTVVTDVAAEELGLSREWVTGKVGNSTYPPGPASGGSVTSHAAAPAVQEAARNLKNLVVDLVAAEWGVPAADVALANGEFTAPGKPPLPWARACALLRSEKITASGRANDPMRGDGNSYGVQFADVSVDTETGIVKVNRVVAVQACGKPVNRHTVENQIYGGVIQGISFVLYENRWLDRITGAMVNPNLEWYKIIGSKDVPEIIPVLDREETDTGVRSLGEPATNPTAGAIGNAVANAIGARVRTMPINPMRVLQALDQKG